MYRPWAMFGVASFFYLYEFLLRVAPSAMFQQLLDVYKIDATQLGLLSSSYYLAYASLQLPVGAWMDRLGPRRLLTAAILLCAVSTILSANTNSFAVACLARFLIGAGSAFAFISCMKIVAIWFERPLFPLLTGLTLTVGTLGAVAGKYPIAFALNWMDWRHLLNVIGVAGIVVALASWWFIRDTNPSISEDNGTTSTESSFWQNLRAVASNRQNWWIALYGLLTTGPTDAFGGMWGDPYLVHAHGFAQSEAAIVASMTFLGLALGSPFLGWLSASWSSRRKPMVLGALIAALSLAAIVYLPVLTPLTAGILFFTFGFFGNYVLCFVAVRDVNQTRYVGTAVGFANMASMVGSTTLMYCIGHLLDYSRKLSGVTETVYNISDYQFALNILPIAYVLCIVLVLSKMKESFQPQ
ncbi:MAG: MFS transporter [Pseudomonadota bacterium]